MSYIHKNRYFITYTRQYDFLLMIFTTVKDTLERKYQSIYFSTPSSNSNNNSTGITNNTFERISHTKIKFMAYCRAIQSTFSCTLLAHEFSDMIRQILCKEIIEYSLPFPGHKIPHNITTEHIFGIPSSMIQSHGMNIAFLYFITSD